MSLFAKQTATRRRQQRRSTAGSVSSSSSTNCATASMIRTDIRSAPTGNPSRSQSDAPCSFLAALLRYLVRGDRLHQLVHRHRPVPGRAGQRIPAQRRQHLPRPVHPPATAPAPRPPPGSAVRPAQDAVAAAATAGSLGAQNASSRNCPAAGHSALRLVISTRPFPTVGTNASTASGPGALSNTSIYPAAQSARAPCTATTGSRPAPAPPAQLPVR